jgi:hypothetical protein
MCDSCVHTIKELHGSDSTSQAPIDPNGPLHSNWVGLPKPVSQSVTSKQHVHLIAQTTLLERLWRKF